jgi:hypothetical protein
MPSPNSDGSSTMATRARALGSSPFLDPSPTLGFFVFDLVVVLVELFSTMRVTQRELPKPKAKLGVLFLKHHCQTLMGVQ